MQVAWALLCRYAEAAADGTATLVGAGLDSVWSHEMPADVGVFLMMRISGPPYEFEEQHTLAVTLIDPERDEHEVLSLNFGPMDEPPPLYHPGMDPGILVPAAIGWQAGHFGLYTLDVSINGKRERSMPLLVRDASELEQPPA